MFDKYVIVFEVKGNRKQWKEVITMLKEAGLSVKKAIWQDEIGAVGCGPALDPRDFGTKGKIDRDVYTIRVKEKEQDAALQLIHEKSPSYVPYDRNSVEKRL
ncbi:MAG: hypothetical protein ACI4ET_12930 [Bilifractor sp.]